MRLSVNVDKLYTWGHLSVLLRLYTRFLNFDIPPSVKALFLGKLGLVHRDLADYVKAMECYEIALSLARSQEDRHAEATQLVNIGDLYDYSGDAERAISFHESALPLVRGANDERLAARAYGCLGNALKESGKIKEATSYYKKAISLCKRIGDKRYEGIWTGDLANVHADTKDISQALRLYQQALNIARSVGDRIHESWWLGVMGRLYGERNDYGPALDCLQSALVTSTAILFRRGMRSQIQSLLDVGRKTKRLPEVLEILNTVKALVQNTEGSSFDFGPEEYLIAKSLFEEAEKYVREGDYKQASKHYGEAIEIEFVKAEALAQRARCRRILAYGSNRADEYLRAAINDYSLAIQLKPSEDGYYMLRGACHAQRGDLRRALVDYGGALERNPANGLAVLGKMEAEICLDNHEDALKTYETLDPEVLPPNQRVISASLVCIAKTLLGQSFEEHVSQLVDTDVILTDTADWCNIEIDRYLAHIEKNLSPTQLKCVKGIQAMFRAHFSSK